MILTDDDVNQMARFIMQHADPHSHTRFYGDHACGQCIQELHISDSRRTGQKKFTCAYHTAKAIVEARGLIV